MRKEFIDDGVSKSLKRGILTVNYPVLLVADGDVTEFTLRKEGGFCRGGCRGDILGAGVAIVTFVPLHPNCFSVSGNVLVKGGGDLRGKGDGDVVRRPRGAASHPGA